MKMKTCTKCGKSCHPDDKFCGFCGFNLAALDTSQLVTQRSLKADDIQYNLGKVYYEMGKYAQAVETFERILKEHPDDETARDMYERARKALEATPDS